MRKGLSIANVMECVSDILYRRKSPKNEDRNKLDRIQTSMREFKQ